jgi:hypothetical protein
VIVASKPQTGDEVSRETLDYQHRNNHVKASEPRRLWFVLPYGLVRVAGTARLTVGVVAESQPSSSHLEHFAVC